MPVSKHKRKGKVKGQMGKGKAAQFQAINKRLAAQNNRDVTGEIMGMMADMIHASDMRKQADVRSI